MSGQSSPRRAAAEPSRSGRGDCSAPDEGDVMASASTDRATRVLVVLNPKSGRFTADAVGGGGERHSPCEAGACPVLDRTNGADLAPTIREAVARGVDLVVAAGGDGT